MISDSIWFDTRFGSPKEKIVEIMRKAINQCVIENRVIDWEKFREYCIEYFIIPVSLINTCIEEAKMEGFYHGI